MKNPIQRVPEMFARFGKVAWPILTGRPETLPEAQERKADQLAANQEWEDEGGTIKPPVAPPTPAPKIPL